MNLEDVEFLKKELLACINSYLRMMHASREVRDAQNNYWTSRSHSDLNTAKSKERRFDKALRIREEEFKKKRTNLFPNYKDESNLKTGTMEINFSQKESN